MPFMTITMHITIELPFLKLSSSNLAGVEDPGEEFEPPLAAKVKIFLNCLLGVKKGAQHPETFLHGRPIVKIADEKNAFFQLFLWLIMDHISEHIVFKISSPRPPNCGQHTV
jgi:hypothetical protein